mmetsp:Transcript_59537/g.141693  ORF Transcript_59537/g.141693 Transcript_59537/m.141693 type:complete len:458 (+) Transcript_59537:73-1446(+)
MPQSAKRGGMPRDRWSRSRLTIVSLLGLGVSCSAVVRAALGASSPLAWMFSGAWRGARGCHRDVAGHNSRLPMLAAEDAEVEIMALRRSDVLRFGSLSGVGAFASGPVSPVSALANTADEKEAVRVFKTATPGVVALAKRERRGAVRPQDGSENPPSVGSGFVWDQNHVVTNFHVVKDIGKDDIEIVFLQPNKSPDDDPRREVLRGEVVGTDPATDTAVVRVENLTRTRLVPMQPLARGKSALLDVGQTVYAIGNPFGLEHSMSRGIISGIARTLELGDRPIRGCIQTDASINPGNSGGPLLDSTGKVIGVNTAILTPSGSFAGIGLAIPIDTVERNVEVLLKQGFVSRGFLGITFGPDVVSQVLQLPGVVVYSVVPGSPAEQAGVRPKANSTLGDLVTSIDGKQVRTGSDIFRCLDKRVPGDTIVLGLQRASRQVNGTEVVEELALNVTLAASPRK